MHIIKTGPAVMSVGDSKFGKTKHWTNKRLNMHINKDPAVESLGDAPI